MNTVGSHFFRKLVRALGRAARDLVVNGLVVARIARDEVEGKPRPFCVRQRIGEPDAVEAALQALQVFGKPERMARIDRHHFVHAVAEYETAVEHRHARFFDAA